MSEDEIELSLGLGIGGRSSRDFNKAETLMTSLVEEEEEMDVVRRREMQAWRRQEARKKREEKLRRVGDLKRRVAVAESAGGDERAAKKVKSQPKSKLKTTPFNEGGEKNMNLAESAACVFPIYAYQYVPFASGFAFPCIAPVYTDASNKSSVGGVGGGGKVQTVSFRPFQKRNGGGGVGEVKAVSNGSSAISENRSISTQDGSSSDSGSHGSGTKSGRTELHSSSGSDVPISSKFGASSNPSTISNAEKSNNGQPATALQANPAKDSEAPVVQSKPATTIPISGKANSPQPLTPSTKDFKPERISPGKPPRPQPVKNQHTSPPIPQMPCVSATGDGPDGKTITGFLYRYSTTTEVSIVCVCHGESFSPAEFVRHAGGVDVTNPLRHITVVPSVF